MASRFVWLMCFLFFAFGSVFLSVQRETIGSFLRRAVKNDTIHQANADATSDADSERRDMDDNRRALWFLTASGGRPRRRFNGAVVALSLINSNTNQAIVNLTNNQVIALDEIGLSAPAFSIQAWTSNVGIESVVFRHVDGLNNSTLAQRRETEPPWTLCGNVASEFTTCLELGLGQHAVTATPYATKRAARPSKGKAMTVSFWIVQSKAEAAPMSAVPAPTVVHLPLPPPLNAPIAADPATAPAPTSPAISPIVDIVPSAPFASGPAAPVVAAPVNANAPQLAAPALVSGPLPVPPSPVQSPKGSLPASPITVAPKIPPVGSNPMPKASSKSPAVAPVKAPKSESSPVSAAVQCSIPKLEGSSWQGSQKYPIHVAEAQGAMIGNTLLIVSGFNNSYETTTTEVYGLDTSNTSSSSSSSSGNAKTWQRFDDQPVPVGITHAGFAVVNDTTLFTCGGYVGANKGPTTNQCFVWDSTKPSGQQWTTLPSLPGLGAGGGAMVYSARLNALIVTGGAHRQKGAATVDVNNTWLYSFDKPNAGWVAKAPIPYKGNHLSFVTVRDVNAKIERHFFAGGQGQEDEQFGNLDHHYEYIVANDTWIRRQSLSTRRGHTSSSTLAIGHCGYIMIGGTSNGWHRLANISYYNMHNDSWHDIGALPWGINTPVCDINRVTNMLYCESGETTYPYSFKRKILF